MPRPVHMLLHHQSCCLLVFVVCAASCLLPNCFCAPLRFSTVSVALTFNASPSARAPSAPILFPALFIISDVVPLFAAKLLLHTAQSQCCQCCIDFQYLAHNTCSFITDPVGCLLSMFVLVLVCCQTAAVHIASSVPSALC